MIIPVAMGLIDSALVGQSGKNTYDLNNDEDTFKIDVQPVIWKFENIEYRVPVVIRSMNSMLT